MDAALSKKVCRLIAGIVVADDDLHDEEDKFLDRMLVRFGIPASERDMLFPIVLQTQAARAYCFEMRPAGDQAHFSPRLSKAYAEIAADRAGTEDAHLHFLS